MHNKVQLFITFLKPKFSRKFNIYVGIPTLNTTLEHDTKLF